MDNLVITDRIKKQIETLILESILALLDKLTEQVICVKDNAANPIIRSEEKF